MFRVMGLVPMCEPLLIYIGALPCLYSDIKPCDGESNGREHGKLHGSWDYIVVYGNSVWNT